MTKKDLRSIIISVIVAIPAALITLLVFKSCGQ